MVGQPLRLGPFIGGLNTASDPTAIGDAELATCSNFELDIDGSLVSRPPITELLGHSGWTERIVMLTEAVFSGTHYLIGSNTNGVYQYTGGVWTLITNTIQAAVAIQYANFVYLVAKPGSANPGGKWSPGGGFVTVADLPDGQAAVVHKARLFVVLGMDATTDTSRVKFSDADDLDTWDPVNFIDVAQGDGTKLIDVVVFQDNLLLFKDRSTYALAYDIRPTDAVLREVSSTIGVERQHCVANFENQVYLFHRGYVYEIINYDFHRLNTKVPFIVDATTPSPFASEHTFVALIEDRLICRAQNQIYVYGLETRTWCQWSSEAGLLHYFGPIVTIHESTGDRYYAGSAVTNFRTMLELFSKSDSDTLEETLNTDLTVMDSFTRTVVDGWGSSEATVPLAYTSSGGAASDYSVNGSVGILSLGSLNVSRRMRLPVGLQNFDATIDIKTSVVATGGTQYVLVRFRVQDDSNFYQIRLDFGTASHGVTLIKKVAGVDTDVVATVGLGAYVATDIIRVRFYANGTALKVKAWKTTALEPNTWTLEGTDAAISAAGSFDFAAVLDPANTNSLPVIISFDNLTTGDPTDLVHTISCSVLTKNFDMAISHQFKKMNWWGADIATNNTIVGTATPIMANFGVTWGQLSSHAWGSLGTWGQPLSVPSSVITEAVSGTGVARRFAKFLKALRYRQINFAIQLTTNGSTVDGPARLFTMTVITSSKQVVPKSVN